MTCQHLVYEYPFLTYPAGHCQVTGCPNCASKDEQNDRLVKRLTVDKKNYKSPTRMTRAVK